VTRTRPVRSPWGSPSRYQIGVRDRHVVVTEHGRLRWRSKRAFTSVTSEFDSVAFAAGKVAFSFFHGRLWVSGFDGHEHAVGWSEGALVWTKRGDLLTLHHAHGRYGLVVRDQNGLRPRRIASGVLNYLVDDQSRTVLYVNTAHVLVHTDGRSKRFLANLASLGFLPRVTLQALPGNLVALSSGRRLAVLRLDGSLFAELDYPAPPAGLQHGWATFAVGKGRVGVAVELFGPKGTVGEDVFALRAGGRSADFLARVQAQWPGCGWVVTLDWHDDWLLYADSVVDVLALDTANGARIDLSQTAQQLPGVHKDENTGQPVGLDFAVWG
jgi:hypothetical protein